MHAFLEAFRAALTSLAAHRLRSFLTTLGILIGTASVIAIVSLVQGFSESIKTQFSNIGGSTLFLVPKNNMEDAMAGRINVITFDDVRMLRYGVKGVKDVAPVLNVAAVATYKGHVGRPTISAATAAYPQVNNQYTEMGRFIVDSDDEGHRRVAVIGADLRDDLNMPANPVGEYFRLGNEWFKVVGVMEKQGKLFGFSRDNFALIPFGVGQAMVGNGIKPDIQVSFTVERLDDVEAVRERVKRAVRVSRKLKPGAEDDFKVEAADSLLKNFDSVISTTTAIVAGIVGISLLVGGIGIMNIMLVSVTERTREIGILKALGATRRDILVQFLLEAGMLALLGGLIGVALGYGLALLVTALVPGMPPAYVPIWVVLTAAGFSALVGVVFGIMPASKAAGLDPIEALRYE